MAKFYEADTVDGVPVLINIDHIQTIKPYESTIGDYDMTKTTICHERFMFTSIDRNYNDVVETIKQLVL
tara:strand:+ start:401 stop:607 length:207 start_codon:yes stop_codon:yes gene_type:complete